MRRQEPHGRQVDRAFGEHFENQREAAGGAGHLDAVVRLMLGEGQYLSTIYKEGPIAGSQVWVTSVQLGEMGDQGGRGLALARSKALQAGDEVGVRESA